MPKYRVERAVLPTSGQRLWLILDDDTLAPMPEALGFAMYLSGAGRSPNTLRSYLPRVASFLNWAHEFPGCDWRTVTLAQMARFKWFLEAPATTNVPLSETDQGKVRSAKTTNITLTAVMEFLRYCSRAGLISQSIPLQFVEPRYLMHMPRSFDSGERGQFRLARVKTLKSREMILPPKTLTQGQIDSLYAACKNARDKLLITLLDATAMRIGEALGLRRSDMHLLPDSTFLGCEVPGPHVHVFRRLDNSNGALSKTIRSRHIPLDDSGIDAYQRYWSLRDSVLGGQDSDFVFVNLWAGRIGSPLTYPAAVGALNRTAARAHVRDFHAHLFRHTTATRWFDEGADIETVKELLGHSSVESTSIYTHASYARMREAVERGARFGRTPK